MNEDEVAGAWRRIRGSVKEHWARFTEDDLKQLEGYAEQLSGRLQELYGLAREEAERQAKLFRDWLTATRKKAAANAATTTEGDRR